MGFSMKSKYEGFCVKCRKQIHKGDEIEKDLSLQKWVHKECPKGKSVLKMMKSSGEGIEGKNTLIDEEKRDDGIFAKKVFEPSPYQQAIFDWIINGNGNAVVEAVAGSGKTTTIVKALEIIPSDKKVLFLAFNKHIVRELKKRVPEHIKVSTIHALGLEQIRKLEDFREIDEDKLGGIMDGFWPIRKNEITNPSLRSENRIKRTMARKIVGLCKATLIDYNNQDEVLSMIDRYSIETDESRLVQVLEKIPTIIENSKNCETVDFDDMPWLPLFNSRLKNHIDKFDFVLIDEAQDLNKCNMQFVLSCVAKDGRVIAVGDRKQSLYGFRGADTEAIPNLIKTLDAIILPLSISYRCPKSHVENVKKIVPQIEPSPFAKDGVIGWIDYKNLLPTIKSGDMVMCRTNAPLVKPAFDTIKMGTKAIIRGKDIGGDLVKFIRRFETDNLGQLEIMMGEYSEKEYQRLIDKGKELQAENVMDKFMTIMEVAHECSNVAELATKLETLFSDDNEGVVFSSVHRAKGLEAERTFILHPEIMPHPKASAEWEKDQESNILYVAQTRSLSEMYFVRGGE